MPTMLLADRDGDKEGGSGAGQQGGEAMACGAGWGHTVLLLRQRRSAPPPQQAAIRSVVTG